MSRPGLGAPKPRGPRYPGSPHPFETGRRSDTVKLTTQDEVDAGIDSDPRNGYMVKPMAIKEKTSWAPNTKVLAGPGIGTPLAGILIWVLGQFGVDMPWDVALYFAGLIIGLVAYFVPEKKS